MAVGLLLQADTSPAFAQERRQTGTSGQPSSHGPGRLGRLLKEAHLLSHLQHGVQWQQLLLAGAQQVWPKADGQVAGAHPAGGHIVANVLQQGQQPLQKEEAGCNQLLGHPEKTGTQGS